MNSTLPPRIRTNVKFSPILEEKEDDESNDFITNPESNEYKYCHLIDDAIRSNVHIFKTFMKNDDYRQLKNNYISKIMDALEILNIRIDKNDFMIKSYLSLLLPYVSYFNAPDNGRLINNSRNSSFLIAEVGPGRRKSKLYIKVADFNSQKISEFSKFYDLIIFDILASLIFELIFEKPYYKNKRNIIPIYKGCSLSYIKHVNDSEEYWNFKEIYDYWRRNTNRSPYDPINLKENNQTYNKKAILVLYEAIDNPISVRNMFIEFKKFYDNNDTNKIRGYGEMIKKMFDKYYDVFNFLIDVGTEYGFIHNDLHLNNIIYNQTNGELMIIDFGRANFMILNDEKINEAIHVDFHKLNYHEILTNENEDSIIDVDKLYRVYKNLYIDYIISEKINSYWGGIVFDLITLSMNMYIKLLAYTYLNNKKEFNELKLYFDLIIEVRFENINDLIYDKNYRFKYNHHSRFYSDEKIIKEYLYIKTNYLSRIDERKKRLYEIILEGLLYSAITEFYFTSYSFQINFERKDYSDHMRKIVDFKRKLESQIGIDEVNQKFKFFSKLNNSPIMPKSSYGGKPSKSLKHKPVSMEDTVNAYKKMFKKQTTTKKRVLKKLI